jgi:SAM-dependent methyltransferase
MTEASRWDKRYSTGDLPWDTGRHDRNLERMLQVAEVAPCKVLELGCGTGTNAIWLAGRGFHVTGIDISPTGIDAAKHKAAAAGVDVRFLAANILEDPLPVGPYDLAIDRGCLHSFDHDVAGGKVSAVVHRALRPGGLWISLIGSKDGPPRDVGPPRWSVREIASAVESRFELLRLESSHFDSDQPNPARAWLCLMRRRESEDCPPAPVTPFPAVPTGG